MENKATIMMKTQLLLNSLLHLTHPKFIWWEKKTAHLFHFFNPNFFMLEGNSLALRRGSGMFIRITTFAFAFFQTDIFSFASNSKLFKEAPYLPPPFQAPTPLFSSFYLLGFFEIPAKILGLWYRGQNSYILFFFLTFCGIQDYLENPFFPKRCLKVR